MSHRWWIWVGAPGSMHRFPASPGMLPGTSNMMARSEPASPAVGGIMSAPSPPQYTMLSAAEQRGHLEPATRLPVDTGLYGPLALVLLPAADRSRCSKYFLDIAQQPLRSRMSGVGEKSMSRFADCVLTCVLDNRRPIGTSDPLLCHSVPDLSRSSSRSQAPCRRC